METTTTETEVTTLGTIFQKNFGQYIKIVQNLNPDKLVDIDYGRRFVKVTISPLEDNHWGYKHVHTFVDLATGDILKAVTYRAPAKNGVRGSIFSNDFGASIINEYGAKYLR